MQHARGEQPLHTTEEQLVFRATSEYDFAPASSSELSLTEGATLLIFPLIMCGTGWWIAMLEETSETGLVPCGFMSPLTLLSVGVDPSAGFCDVPEDGIAMVRVLYQFEAQSHGELTVHPGDLLQAYHPSTAAEGWVFAIKGYDPDSPSVGLVPLSYLAVLQVRERESTDTAHQPEPLAERAETTEMTAKAALPRRSLSSVPISQVVLLVLGIVAAVVYQSLKV